MKNPYAGKAGRRRLAAEIMSSLKPLVGAQILEVTATPVDGLRGDPLVGVETRLLLDVPGVGQVTLVALNADGVKPGLLHVEQSKSGTFGLEAMLDRHGPKS